MFYDRDRKPSRKLLPWSGEFIGKYLCSSILSYRILRDPRQKANIEQLARAFMASQGPDGYLGPFDKETRLTGRLPEWNSTWDMWGHYWAIRGLILYFEEFGDAKALDAAERAPSGGPFRRENRRTKQQRNNRAQERHQRHNGQRALVMPSHFSNVRDKRGPRDRSRTPGSQHQPVD